MGTHRRDPFEFLFGLTKKNKWLLLDDTVTMMVYYVSRGTCAVITHNAAVLDEGSGGAFYIIY